MTPEGLQQQKNDAVFHHHPSSLSFPSRSSSPFPLAPPDCTSHETHLETVTSVAVSFEVLV